LDRLATSSEVEQRPLPEAPGMVKLIAVVGAHALLKPLPPTTVEMLTLSPVPVEQPGFLGPAPGIVVQAAVVDWRIALVWALNAGWLAGPARLPRTLQAMVQAAFLVHLVGPPQVPRTMQALVQVAALGD